MTAPMPDALDDQNVEADGAVLFVGIQQPDHAPVRFAAASDDRPRASLVIIEFERAERRAAGGKERIDRHKGR